MQGSVIFFEEGGDESGIDGRFASPHQFALATFLWSVAGLQPVVLAHRDFRAHHELPAEDLLIHESILTRTYLTLHEKSFRARVEMKDCVDKRIPDEHWSSIGGFPPVGSLVKLRQLLAPVRVAGYFTQEKNGKEVTNGIYGLRLGYEAPDGEFRVRKAVNAIREGRGEVTQPLLGFGMIFGRDVEKVTWNPLLNTTP